MTGTFKIMNKILFKNVTFVLSILETAIGGQDRVVVKRPHREDKDVGSNPAVTEKRTFGDPPTEGSPMVRQDLSGRPTI